MTLSDRDVTVYCVTPTALTINRAAPVIYGLLLLTNFLPDVDSRWCIDPLTLSLPH